MYFVSLSVVPFSVVCFKRKHLLVSWMQTDLGRTVSRVISFLFLLVLSRVPLGTFSFVLVSFVMKSFLKYPGTVDFACRLVSLFQRKRPFSDDGKAYIRAKNGPPQCSHSPSQGCELVYVEEDVIKIQLWSWGDCPG